MATVLKEAFSAWCKSIGIAPRSHDYSIAKAAWEAGIKAVAELTKTETKEKNNES